MDKYLNQAQEQIQFLIETKAYENLSSDERNLVMSEMSADEFKLRALAISEARFVSADAEPRALILKKEKKGVLIPIPLWQAIASVAAAVLISFFLFRTNNTITIEKEAPLYAVADTVYVDRQIIDTVVEFKTEYVNRYISNVDEELVVDISSKNQQFDKVASSNNVQQEIADLDPKKLANKGNSISNDETFSLLDGLVLPN